MKALIPTTLALSSLCVGAVAQSRPNIIFFMVDDMGIGDVGAYGQRYIPTPALDSLATEGMTFTQAYAGCSVSAPSRGSVLTGRHTGNAYIRGNQNVESTDGRIYDRALAQDEVTVAEMLKEVGYDTACIGKWGLGGPDTEGAPWRQGFDYFFGYLGQLSAHRHRPTFLHEQDAVIELDGKTYAQDLLMERAIDFLRDGQRKESPFFLYFTPTLPHADLDAEEEDKAAFEGQFCERPFKGDWYRAEEQPKATYAGMVSRIDRDVRRMIEVLQEEGLAENTLFIFTSDNGAHEEGGHDPYFFDGNGPYRGLKRALYEGGIRVPFIAVWPGTIRANSTSYHPIAFWDVMPTLQELAGAKAQPQSDGISFYPTLTGEGEQEQHDFLYWEFHEEGGRQAVRVGEWKLIRQQVREASKTHDELFNLAADPGELRNVAVDYPEVVKELGAIIDREHTASQVFPLLPDEQR
ncbi:MAG: arylsulfatase [Porphyromonas sp.]|nr:arylsulfatase [Porphyromonas sp.]